jgi:tetratricopeptide (TPR) repeat protein
LEQALKIDDSDWMNWGNLADALYWSPDRRLQASAKYQEAAKIGTSRLQINPRDADTLAYLANYSAMLDDRQAAFSYIQRALELAPSKGEVLFRAAIVYNHFGQTNQTLAYLEKAVNVGYSRTIIRDTPDFQPLQQNPQFRALAGVPHETSTLPHSHSHGLRAAAKVAGCTVDAKGAIGKLSA